MQDGRDGSPDPPRLSGLSDDEALDVLAAYVDDASDEGDLLALERGIALCRQFRAREVPTEHAATSHYFESNALESLRLLRRSMPELWDWEQPEYTQGLVALRRAWQLGRNSQLSKHRKAQILTNLANALSHVGRVVEAIRLWNGALGEMDPFPMAQGNRGRGFHSYAQRTHDPGHQWLLMRQAYADLRSALECELHPGATAGFEPIAEHIRQFYGDERLLGEFDLDKHALGQDDEEIRYREWCLFHGLFLNPLNELGRHTVAAADPLVLPGITGPLDQGPSHFGFFNQLKQDYVTARFNMYRGTTGSGTHFSDRGVKLINTLDYPVYSRWIEDVKSAFRIAYSLFDKTAYFLNDYFGLGVPPSQVSFKRLWYTDLQRKKGLRADLRSRKNVALQALYWVSRDLFDPDEEYQDVLDPEAQNLAEIRNHIEHKYLKVHEVDPGPRPEVGDLRRGLADTLAYSVGRIDLEEKALRLMHLARATLIYLVQAVYLEEENKRMLDGPEGPILPMFLDEYDDDWKE